MKAYKPGLCVVCPAGQQLPGACSKWRNELQVHAKLLRLHIVIGLPWRHLPSSKLLHRLRQSMRVFLWSARFHLAREEQIWGFHNANILLHLPFSVHLHQVWGYDVRSQAVSGTLAGVEMGQGLHTKVAAVSHTSLPPTSEQRARESHLAGMPLTAGKLELVWPWLWLWLWL